MSPPVWKVRLVPRFTEGKNGEKVPSVTMCELPAGTASDGSGKTRLEVGESIDVYANEFVRAMVARGELERVAAPAPKATTRTAKE